jgi:hypothetical protein
MTTIAIDHADGYRAGCHNLPRPQPGSGYYVMTRCWLKDGRFVLRPEFVPFRNSPECRVGMRLAECDGCAHQKVVADETAMQVELFSANEEIRGGAAVPLESSVIQED